MRNSDGENITCFYGNDVPALFSPVEYDWASLGDDVNQFLGPVFFGWVNLYTGGPLLALLDFYYTRTVGAIPKKVKLAFAAAIFVLALLAVVEGHTHLLVNWLIIHERIAVPQPQQRGYHVLTLVDSSDAQPLLIGPSWRRALRAHHGMHHHHHHHLGRRAMYYRLRANQHLRGLRRHPRCCAALKARVVSIAID